MINTLRNIQFHTYLSIVLLGLILSCSSVDTNENSIEFNNTDIAIMIDTAYVESIKEAYDTLDGFYIKKNKAILNTDLNKKLIKSFVMYMDSTLYFEQDYDEIALAEDFIAPGNVMYDIINGYNLSLWSYFEHMGPEIFNELIGSLINISDRSPEVILNYFNQSKEPWYNALSLETYQSTKLDEQIQILRQIFHEIFDEDGKINDHKRWTEENRSGEEWYKRSWHRGFWTRRYDEGNHKVAYEILCEVYEHYDKVKKDSIRASKTGIKYTNIPQAHITTDNRISYEIDLGRYSKKNEASKRNDFFYKAVNGKTVIYDSWLEYGFLNGLYPCTIFDCYDASSFKLYAHTRQEISPLENIKLVVDSQDVCGSIEPLIWVEHKKIEPEPLFITTMHGTDQTSFIDVASLKVEEWPEWINYGSLLVPQGSENKKVRLYKYGEDSNVFIAEVSSTGWVETEDEDKFGPSEDREWQGIYYISKDKCLIITPIDHHTQSYYGQDFSLIGLQDINGDGGLDIIIGNPVSLILESYKGGFRSWGFAFMPPGGC